MPPPGFDHAVRIVQAAEPVYVQAFIAEYAMKLSA
jgi:hypothetical protein